MKIEIDFFDKHGLPIELGQIIAIKVPRLSGAYSSWYQKRNENHACFWVPGYIKLYKGLGCYDAVGLRVVLDHMSVEALKKPMGTEKIEQVVAECRVEMGNPEFFDSKNIPEPGKFRRGE